MVEDQNQLKKKFPHLRVIHRLDNSYQFICKNYGFDSMVKMINEISDLTIHQSNFSVDIWNGKYNNIFKHYLKINIK